MSEREKINLVFAILGGFWVIFISTIFICAYLGLLGNG
jgi:hypothetical protein